MYNFTILYHKGSENDKADTLSQKANYFKKKKTSWASILRTNRDSSLLYNYIILAVIF